MKPSDFLTELSNDKLTQYKTAAAADASKADKEGDFKKGDKRFSGIVKATKKQFDNDAKKDVAEGWKDVVAGGAMALGALGAGAQTMPDINVQRVELANKYYNVLVQRAKEDGIKLDTRTLNVIKAKAQDAAAKKTQQSTYQQGFSGQGSERKVAKDAGQFESQGVAEGSLGTALPWPNVVNKVSGAMKAMGWKGTRKADGTFMFSTRGQETDDQYYIVIIDNAGEGFFTYALGTIEEGDPRIGEQESLPNTEASVSELMNAIRDGFGLSEQGVAEEKCPHCNGPMVSEELMNEKKDACYYKVKSRYKVWPSAYASGALVKCRKKGADSWGNGSKNESSILEGIEQADESLHDWFNKEKWVRMDTKGNIKGPCAKEPGEGKPKCLPQAKAHSLGKKGRASAAARKRREDPNPDRSGKAINVNTKKD